MEYRLHREIGRESAKKREERDAREEEKEGEKER